MSKYTKLFGVIILLVGLAILTVIKVPTRYGLDIKGGTRLVLQAQTKQLPAGEKWDSEKNLPAIIRILTKRINADGVSEPLIQPKGNDQIVMELPGLTKDQAIKELQTTAQMEFRQFLPVQNERHQLAKYREQRDRDSKTGNETYTFTDNNGQPVPTEKVLSECPLIMNGNDIKPTAKGNIDPQKNESVVEIELTDSGTKKFADFTRKNVGEQLAIVLDGRVLSAPRINDQILNGKAVISGGFQSAEEAQHLADFLNAGALPVPLKIIQQQTVEATIGHVAVEKSTYAGLIGLGAVVLFMIVYYLLPGFLADIALAIYALLTLAAFKLIGVTLTLPGIAAFILSIGMAVDANILIFERLKEELRGGKTLHAAIDAGFSRAFTSIFDSNMCTIITCIILGVLGTGSIKGFAVVLALGVIISMFTAITTTRTLLHMVVNTSLGEKAWLFGLSRQWVSGQQGKQVNIVGRMALWFALSAIIIIPGMFILGTKGLNKGIDFTGGGMWQVNYQKTTEQAQVDETLKSIGLPNSMIQKSADKADPNTFFIRTKEVDAAKALEIKNALKSAGGEVQSEEHVGAVISKELESNALMSVLWASLLIVLYLSIRFAIGGWAQGLRFGVCAIVATLHDVLVIIGVFAFLGWKFGWEIDTLFVTAVLTVIGFSTHDTIVIFDRIRENLRHRVKGENFDGLVNRSICQSFARSINTSLTVILTLTALYIFGGHSNRQFVFALIVGVITGTYSSIFNASQLLVLWQRFTGKDAAGRVLNPGAPGTGAAKVRDLKPLVDVPKSNGGAVSSGVGDADDAVAVAKAKAKRKKRRY